MKISSDELCRLLRKDLVAAKYAEGEALPTLRELEKEYGLHRDTVNRVLGILEGEGLITHNGRRRYPAHRRQSEEKVIALEHVNHKNQHPFFGPLNDGIVDTFLSSDYGAHSFIQRKPDESNFGRGTALSTLLEKGILRGVVFVALGVHSLEDLNMLRDRGVVVCWITSEQVPAAIQIDMEQVALQGIHYLAKRGFDSIGIVSTLDLHEGRDRRGYTLALNLNDIPYRDENVIDCTEIINALGYEITHDGQFEAFSPERLKPIIDGARQVVTDRIRAGNFPRALYISDEFLAIGTMRALHEMGLRVPQDLAVVSHMSSGNSAVELTGLTTMQFDGYSCGMEVARFLIDIAEGRRSADDHLVLQAKLVKGTSCGELDDVDCHETSIE